MYPCVHWTILYEDPKALLGFNIFVTPLGSRLDICMCPSLAIAIIDSCLNTYFIISGTTLTNVLKLSITHLNSIPKFIYLICKRYIVLN